MHSAAMRDSSPKTLTIACSKQAEGFPMKFWLINSMTMLGAVLYAACMASPQTTHSFSPLGHSSRQVSVARVAETYCSSDYCLGFDGAAVQGESPSASTPDKESGKNASEGKNTDASAASNGAQAATDEKPTYLIYFTATWCGPCQQQKPIINEIKDAGKFKVYIVDIDNDPQTARAWGVSTVPTVATVVKGKTTYRGVGAGHTRAFLESKLEAK